MLGTVACGVSLLRSSSIGRLQHLALVSCCRCCCSCKFIFGASVFDEVHVSAVAIVFVLFRGSDVSKKSSTSVEN